MQFGGPRFLQCIPGTPRLQHSQQIVTFVRDSPSQDYEIWLFESQAPGSLGAIDPGHLNIQQNHVGFHSGNKRERLIGSRGLP